MLRKAAQVSNQILEITEVDGLWTFTTSTTLKTMAKQFRLGEEFDERTADMRDVRTLVTLEGDTVVMVERARSSKHKSARSTHQVVEGRLVYTMWQEGEAGVWLLQYGRP